MNYMDEIYKVNESLYNTIYINRENLPDTVDILVYNILKTDPITPNKIERFSGLDKDMKRRGLKEIFEETYNSFDTNHECILTLFDKNLFLLNYETRILQTVLILSISKNKFQSDAMGVLFLDLLKLLSTKHSFHKLKLKSYSEEKWFYYIKEAITAIKELIKFKPVR